MGNSTTAKLGQADGSGDDGADGADVGDSDGLVGGGDGGDSDGGGGGGGVDNSLIFPTFWHTWGLHLPRSVHIPPLGTCDVILSTANIINCRKSVSRLFFWYQFIQLETIKRPNLPRKFNSTQCHFCQFFRCHLKNHDNVNCNDQFVKIYLHLNSIISYSIFCIMILIQ